MRDDSLMLATILLVNMRQFLLFKNIGMGCRHKQYLKQNLAEVTLLYARCALNSIDESHTNIPYIALPESLSLHEDKSVFMFFFRALA